ncbi:PKD domain-containing protein [Geobacter sulfurreducens]|uniref:PKD domain-containing protein n=1 Tax=Geobacter sulfurreducens TaxID=35554 RepID=UPI0005D8CD50|nr:PKD domain-containing protein [Geobacter sulfurreducens]AJY69458.1 cytochrome C [Geobacter sulfurreducens]QVW35012.1 PKD domain-containing protein [Geobacter sulfurreducens]
MARLYNDGAGTAYDSANAKFIDNLFGWTNYLAGTKNLNGAFEPFNFGSAAGFKSKVDNSLAGEMRDCGECHVGGGLMEYMSNTIPTSDYTGGVSYDPAKRTSYRDVVFGGLFTAFNALIDVFNPDPARRGDVVINDYAQTGVMEMDCLICHFEGYDWEKRKEAVRKGEFDASRALGSGLATSAASGVQVTYDTNLVKTNASGDLVVDLSAKLSPVPPADNCASCHLSQYNVDWKKRGDMWIEGTEAHYGIGCMGCHQRKDAASPTVGTSGLVSSTTLGLCDPAKGGASPFDAMWNKLDKSQFKECVDCHAPTSTPTYDTYNAPNPVSAHAIKGLTDKIAFDKDGNSVSHIELIDCSACHIRKSGFTGGAFVDGTGADEEGRLALHDEPQVSRDMTNGVALHWLGGKLYSANLLTSFFWRDVNGLAAGLDVNNDGRTAGMDALLQTHVNDINLAAGLQALTKDGIVTPAEITTSINALKGNSLGTGGGDTGIKAYLGIDDPTNAKVFLPKLSFLMVPFKSSHNIARGSEAWGAKGCKECHADGAGFYNGTYPVNGNMEGKFNYSSAQAATFTKVNGLSDPSDSHPNVVTKKGDRSMPVQIITADNPYSTTAVNANATIRNIDRSEMLYEATFKAVNTAWYDETAPIMGATRPAACSGATSPFYCAAPGGAAAKAGATSTLGWLLKIDTTADNGATVVSRTKQISSDMVASVDDIITNLGATFTGGFEFTMVAIDTNSDSVNDALKITAKPGYKIRINAQCDAGPFGFAGSLYQADPIVRAAGTFAGRTAYVGYLNAIGSAPAAVIATVGTTDATGNPAEITVTQGNVALTAAAAGALPADKYSYSWTCSDAAGTSEGQSVTRAFNSLGTYDLTLRVKNLYTNEEKVDQIKVKVTAPAPAAGVAVAAAGISYNSPSAGYAIIPLTITGVTFNKVKVVWGDGNTNIYTTSDANFVLPSHKFWGYPAKKSFTAKVYVYNGTTLAAQNDNITVLFP